GTKYKSVGSDKRNRRLCYLLGEHRSDPKGERSGHVHGRTAICIPKLLSGERSSGQYPENRSLMFRIRKRVVPLGFCSGGFSSTAGYVPGNEAYVRRHKRHSSQTAVPFRMVPLVFIRAASAERPEGRCLAKPFGFDLRCYSTVDPLDVLSNLTSPLSSLSSGRSKARKHF